MSTSQFCRQWQPIPLRDIGSIDFHFKLPCLDMLPDEVYLEIPKTHSSGGEDPKPKNGSLVFFEPSIALPQLFFGLEQNGFPNVGFRGDWVQCDSPLNDKFSVHFRFVHRNKRDLIKAIRHDSEMAGRAFNDLSSKRWNVSGFSNDEGSFDFTLHRPRNQPGVSALLVDGEFLGLR